MGHRRANRAFVLLLVIVTEISLAASTPRYSQQSISHDLATRNGHEWQLKSDPKSAFEASSSSNSVQRESIQNIQQSLPPSPANLTHTPIRISAVAAHMGPAQQKIYHEGGRPGRGSSSPGKIDTNSFLGVGHQPDHIDQKERKEPQNLGLDPSRLETSFATHYRSGMMAGQVASPYQNVESNSEAKALGDDFPQIGLNGFNYLHSVQKRSVDMQKQQPFLHGQNPLALFLPYQQERPLANTMPSWQPKHFQIPHPSYPVVGSVPAQQHPAVDESKKPSFSKWEPPAKAVTASLQALQGHLVNTPLPKPVDLRSIMNLAAPYVSQPLLIRPALHVELTKPQQANLEGPPNVLSLGKLQSPQKLQPSHLVPPRAQMMQYPTKNAIVKHRQESFEDLHEEDHSPPYANPAWNMNRPQSMMYPEHSIAILQQPKEIRVPQQPPPSVPQNRQLAEMLSPGRQEPRKVAPPPPRILNPSPAMERKIMENPLKTEDFLARHYNTPMPASFDVLSDYLPLPCQILYNPDYPLLSQCEDHYRMRLEEVPPYAFPNGASNAQDQYSSPQAGGYTVPVTITSQITHSPEDLLNGPNSVPASNIDSPLGTFSKTKQNDLKPGVLAFLPPSPMNFDRAHDQASSRKKQQTKIEAQMQQKTKHNYTQTSYKQLPSNMAAKQPDRLTYPKPGMSHRPPASEEVGRRARRTNLEHVIGQCSSDYTNCLTGGNLECDQHGTLLDLTFGRDFEGLVYIEGQLDECILYSAPALEARSKTIQLFMADTFCSRHLKGKLGYEGPESETAHGRKPFPIVVQFHAYRPTSGSLRFVVQCENDYF